MRACAARLAATLLLLSVVAGCGGPAYRVKVYDTPESKGLKGHQKPYSVNGQYYAPLRDGNGYVEEGVASWYGPDFHGKPTSCGEIYDMHAFTAAHKILPLGVSVRVTNLKNGKSTVVRVNDRGPFVKSRIIDLSMAAAKELDVVANGTAPVRIEALGRRTENGYQPLADYRRGNFTIQVGAFRDEENARRLSAELKKRYQVSTIQQGWVNNSLFHRVRAGSYSSLDDAETAKHTFEADGFANAFVVAVQ